VVAAVGEGDGESDAEVEGDGDWGGAVVGPVAVGVGEGPPPQAARVAAPSTAATRSSRGKSMPEPRVSLGLM
jgi:hypothetical protein